MVCPACKGKGKFSGYGCPGFKPIVMDCDICRGSGELPHGIVYDPERGKALKETRKEPYATMLQQSKKLGISLTELSRRERGFF